MVSFLKYPHMKKKLDLFFEDRIEVIDGISYQKIGDKLYRYADLTLDKGFKIVLGMPGNEELLKNLLNRLLGTQIVHLEYRNNEYPGTVEEDRTSHFDVHCTDDSGNGFLVEMQNWDQTFFNKRAAYYSSLVLQVQAREEQRRQKRLKKKKTDKNWDYNFQPLFVVSFLNFASRLIDDSEKRKNRYISTYRYLDVETGRELGDGTTLVFIDVHRFRKDIAECDSLADLWMYSLKNISWMSKCPTKIEGTEIEDLFTSAELAKMTTEQRISYEKSLMNKNDYLNVLEQQREAARIKGLEIGFSEGRAEGRAEGREEGLAEGRKEGRAEGRKEGIAEGRKEGRSEGRKEGRAEGIAEGRKEGRAEGRAEGMSEGMEAERTANVVRMYQNGIDKELISKISGYSIEKVDIILSAES